MITVRWEIWTLGRLEIFKINSKKTVQFSNYLGYLFTTAIQINATPIRLFVFFESISLLLKITVNFDFGNHPHLDQKSNVKSILATQKTCNFDCWVGYPEQAYSFRWLKSEWCSKSANHELQFWYFSQKSISLTWRVKFRFTETEIGAGSNIWEVFKNHRPKKPSFQYVARLQMASN